MSSSEKKKVYRSRIFITGEKTKEALINQERPSHGIMAHCNRQDEPASIIGRRAQERNSMLCPFAGRAIDASCTSSAMAVPSLAAGLPSRRRSER